MSPAWSRLPYTDPRPSFPGVLILIRFQRTLLEFGISLETAMGPQDEDEGEDLSPIAKKTHARTASAPPDTPSPAADPLRPRWRVPTSWRSGKARRHATCGVRLLGENDPVVHAKGELGVDRTTLTVGPGPSSDE